MRSRTSLEHRPLALRAGILFDGDQTLGKGMVLIQDGVIVDVDTSGAPPPDDAIVHDFGDGVCLIPGLIDCHVHLALDATTDALTTLASEDDDSLLERMTSAATTALSAGITTVRDLGDRGFLTLRLRDELAKNGMASPEILAAGPPLTTPGGHFAVLGGEVSGAEELRAAVRERAARGCEVIKVMASGGAATPGSRPYDSQFGLEDLRLIADHAHASGLTAAAHAHAVTSIADALDAGFDTLEHVTFMTPDGVDAPQRLIERIAERGTVVGLTVGSVPGAGVPPPAIARRLETLHANASRLGASGARIVLGTDAGIGPGKPHDVLRHALAALVDLGMSPVSALHAVTAVAADACAVGDRKGRLAAGYDADLVAIAGDPCTDISNVHNVIAVYRDGRLAVDHGSAR